LILPRRHYAFDCHCFATFITPVYIADTLSPLESCRRYCAAADDLYADAAMRAPLCHAMLIVFFISPECIRYALAIIFPPFFHYATPPRFRQYTALAPPLPHSCAAHSVFIFAFRYFRCCCATPLRAASLC